VGVILSTLSAQTVLELTGQPLSLSQDPAPVLLAYVYFYDKHIVLNQADPLTHELAPDLTALLAQEHVAITLSQT
jgi:hypothetical protein